MTSGRWCIRQPLDRLDWHARAGPGRRIARRDFAGVAVTRFERRGGLTVHHRDLVAGAGAARRRRVTPITPAPRTSTFIATGAPSAAAAMVGAASCGVMRRCRTGGAHRGRAVMVHGWAASSSRAARTCRASSRRRVDVRHRRQRTTHSRSALRGPRSALHRARAATRRCPGPGSRHLRGRSGACGARCKPTSPATRCPATYAPVTRSYECTPIRSRAPIPRLSYGFVAGPGPFETTLTRPDLYASYYLEQFRLLLQNHGVELEIGTSAQPIPVHFSFAEHDHIEGNLTPSAAC